MPSRLPLTSWPPNRVIRHLKARNSHRKRGIITAVMMPKLSGFWSFVCLLTVAVGLSAQTPVQTPQAPTFRVQIDAVTMDVIVKDGDGRFVPDLKRDQFEIYEDGVKQEIASMTMSHGGRVTNLLEAPPPPPLKASFSRPSAESPTHQAGSSCSLWTTCICSFRVQVAFESCSRRSDARWFTKAICSASSPVVRRRFRST